MRCARCRNDNRTGRRYCGRCGAQLPGACAACGFVNEPHERFCGGCGIPTSDAPVRELAPADAERRQLTVLFCDLVGSTALSNHLDAEDLREVIQSFQRACAGEIARFGGYVARYMGDGLLAYFGYPQAHEDDAERGVRAGLALVDAVAALMPPEGVEKLQVRVGIATGRVIAGDLIGTGASEEQAIVGDTPNLAARLQSLADPDTVVVSAITQRVVGGLFEVADLGRHALKGFDEKQHAWQVLGPRRMGRRFAARMGGILRPMVGREQELEELLGAWSRAGRSQGQVVLLVGEAGMGKSRLLAELEASIASDDPIVETLQAASHREESPLYPVLEAAFDHAGMLETDDDAARLQKLMQWLEREEAAPEEAALFVSLAGLDAGDALPAPPPDPEEHRRATLKACVDRIFARTRQAPTVLVVEDAQWLDPTTLEFLRMTAGQTRDRRLLLCITTRPDAGEPLPGDAVDRRIVLQRLDPQQSERIVRGIDSEGRLDGATTQRVAQRADGVPLFIEELAMSVLEGIAAGNPSAVPATLADSLMARLDRLPGAKEVAQMAAVIGRRFSERLLADVWEGAPSALLDGVDRLVQAEVLVPAAGGGYQFRQALVRDVALESLLRSRRRAVHGRIARAMEQGAGEGVDGAEVLAFHLFEAGEPVAAAAAWNRAAELAESRSSNAEATRNRRKALDALMAQESSKDNAQRRAETALALGRVLRQNEQLDAAEEAATAAETEIGAFDLAELRPAALHLRGNIRFLRGDVAGCLDAHTRGLEAARAIGSPLAEANALGGMGDANYARGHMRSSFESFTACTELCRGHGFEETLMRNLPVQGWSRFWLKDFEGTVADGTEALELATKLGYVRAQQLAHGCIAYAAATLGRYVEAIEHAEAALAGARHIGSRFFELSMLYNLSRALRLAGRLDERARVLHGAAPVLMGAMTSAMSTPVLVALASVIVDPERREKVFTQAEERIASRPSIVHIKLWFYDEALVLAMQLGDVARARRFADTLEAITSSQPTPWSTERVALVRSTLAALEGPPG